MSDVVGVDDICKGEAGLEYTPLVATVSGMPEHRLFTWYDQIRRPLHGLDTLSGQGNVRGSSLARTSER